MMLIHSPADEHLGCFHFWTITSNTAVNIHTQVSACGYMLLILSRARLGAELLSEVRTLCLPLSFTCFSCSHGFRYTPCVAGPSVWL